MFMRLARAREIRLALRESHRNVVSVDRFRVVCSAGWSESLSGGQQRFDGFVSEYDQRGDRRQAGGQRLVA